VQYNALRLTLLLVLFLGWIVEEARLLLVYHLPSVDFLVTLVVFVGTLWLTRRA